jgi:hypothetical protein
MRLISLFPLPVPPPGRHFKNFREKGGRFGPHNVNQEIHLPDVEKPGNLIYLTYFNAGLRVYNIMDPVQPVEAGWFVPPDPEKNAGPLPKDLVTQTEDVLVDYPGLHLCYRQELGSMDSALSRAGSAGYNRPVTFR